MTAEQYLVQLDTLRWRGEYQAVLDLATARRGIALTPAQRGRAEVALAFASRMLALAAAERLTAPTDVPPASPAPARQA